MNEMESGAKAEEKAECRLPGSAPGTSQQLTVAARSLGSCRNKWREFISFSASTRHIPF